MRRTALLFLCVLGLALAGCSGPSDGAGDGPAVDVTAADPPTIATTTDDPLAGDTVTVETPTPEPVMTARPDATFRDIEMPPGTDRRGIVNSDALERANRRLLGETDFVLVTNETTIEWTNGTVARRSMDNGTIAISAHDVARYQFRSASLYRGERHRLWREGYTRNGTEYEAENAISYDVSNESENHVTNGTVSGVENGTYRSMARSVSEWRRSIARFTLGGRLHAGSWEPTDTTTVDGRPAVVFALSPDDHREASYEGRLVVDTRGLVHELTYRIDSTDGQDRRLVAVTYDLDIPPTLDLERPSWLSAARNATRDGSERTHSTVVTTASVE